MLRSVEQSKDEVNIIISNGLKEILHKGLRITSKSLGGLEDDIGIMMRALQHKKKLYDYAVQINYNDLFGIYEGIIIYQLIKLDEPQYEGIVNFNF